MGISNVEKLFDWIDKTSEQFGEHQNVTYLEGLVDAMGIMYSQEVPNDIDDILAQKLKTTLSQIHIEQYEKEEIRKAIQLAIIKGMKDSTQAQHLLTPEAIALIIGYLADKFTEGWKSLRIFDPVSGTGNLLFTVLDRLKNKETETFASEVDPTLIQLAVTSANLLEKEIEFFRQDSLSPFLLDPVDLVVADLPVGYYPDDIRARDFKLRADEGHSFAHHLLIEQSLRYTKDSGILIFIIPESLFSSGQSEKLNEFLREHAHILGLLQLPDTAFKSKNNHKSILILQKKGEHTTGVKQPLLVQVPSFKNKNAMADILGQMNAWFKTYHTNK